VTVVGGGTGSVDGGGGGARVVTGVLGTDPAVVVCAGLVLRAAVVAPVVVAGVGA